MFNGSLPSLLEQAFQNGNITYDENLHWRNAFDFIAKSEHPDNDQPFQKANPSQVSLKRSTRIRRPNPKCFNDYARLKKIDGPEGSKGRKRNIVTIHLYFRQLKNIDIFNFYFTSGCLLHIIRAHKINILFLDEIS